MGKQRCIQRWQINMETGKLDERHAGELDLITSCSSRLRGCDKICSVVGQFVARLITLALWRWRRAQCWETVRKCSNQMRSLKMLQRTVQTNLLLGAFNVVNIWHA